MQETKIVGRRAFAFQAALEKAIEGDVQQLLHNIAVRTCHEPGSVSVSIDAKARTLTLTLTDNVAEDVVVLSWTERDSKGRPLINITVNGDLVSRGGVTAATYWISGWLVGVVGNRT